LECGGLPPLSDCGSLLPRTSGGASSCAAWQAHTDGEHLKTLGKLLLGILSFEPLVFFGLFFFWLLPSFMVQPDDGQESLFSDRFDVLIPLAIASSVLILALLLVYAVLLARRPDVHIAEKVGVPLGIFFTNGIVLPLVWWLYVWRESNLTAISRPTRPESGRTAGGGLSSPPEP
jgi:hypothetical protein